MNIKLENPYVLPPGNYYQISFTDMGIGIPLENQSEIFTPNFTTKSQNQGMGLAISKSIIERHLGAIYFSSMPEEGTKFTILLPSLESYSSLTLGQDANVINALPSLKILILEDDPTIQKILARILTKLGHQATITTTGEEFLEFYSQKPKSQQFDLIIMDLIIENGMGGKEAITKLRNIDSDVKVIVSSGYSNDPIMANFSEYGFNGVLSKPYTIEEMQQKFAEIFVQKPH